MTPRLAIDNAAERSGREPRSPGDPATQPREQAADIEFAAADPDLEKPRLIKGTMTPVEQATSNTTSYPERRLVSCGSKPTNGIFVFFSRDLRRTIGSVLNCVSR